MMDKRLFLIEYAKCFIGSVYKWAGEGPYNIGFDCSGFVLELLLAAGFWKKSEGDATSQAIYDRRANNTTKRLPSQIKIGCLLFFGKDTKSITHITMAYDEELMIEAGGGGSKTVNVGMVRVRPINSRKDLVAVLDIIDD